MPALNDEARRLKGSNAGHAVEAIAALAREYRTAFLVGGLYLGDWQPRGEYVVSMDRRNSAYLIDSAGRLAPNRYDKIHLVPFGEYIPFKHSIPWLYRLFIHFGPNYYEEYVLTPGGELTCFDLPQGVRFVVPICFEDLVPNLVAAMIRDPGGGKRADLIVNITNDGWFRGSQMSQHFQAAVFRSIEHRVPTARSVNTGISGFIDSAGRASGRIPAGTEGTSMARLLLDRRVTPFTRLGDVFGLTCAGSTLAVVCWMMLGWLKHKRTYRPNERMQP
jgi:apolipoprotein N-acyltransferase